MTETADEAIRGKRCVKCGSDVSGRRRMKDSQGRYWCYDCGAEDQARKGVGVLTPCAACGKHTPPQQLYKVGVEYVCDRCRESRREGRSLSAESKDRLKLIVAVVLCLFGMALITLYATGWF